MTILILATPIAALAGMLYLPQPHDARHAAPSPARARRESAATVTSRAELPKPSAVSPLLSIAPAAVAVSLALVVGSAVIRAAA